jgi:colanic acid biosynthesis glycosyl transferase WcaI
VSESLIPATESAAKRLLIGLPFNRAPTPTVRIVISDYLGHAPQVQLSRALAARGHDVLHLYSGDVQSPKADLTRQGGDPPGLAIEGLSIGAPRARSFFARRRQEAKFGRLLAQRTTAFRPDAVMACNNPLDVQSKIQSACTSANIPFIYWMQDFQSLEIDRAIANRGAIMNILVGGYYHGLERKLLQRSEAIVPIADDMLSILSESWDIFDRQCMVVRNWSPLDKLAPGDKSNAWSRAQGLADRKVALYTGSLGPMENPMLLVELAEKLKGRSDALVLVISEGAGASEVAREAKSRGLSNLRVLAFQPYESYGDVLASADVLLAMVSGQAGVLYVPSKANSYLCAGRAIVIAAPWQNLAATTIQESQGGSVVAPDDAAAMADAVTALMTDDKRRAEAAAHAREYAERMFEISTIAERFERLFLRLASGTPRHRLPQQ